MSLYPTFEELKVDQLLNEQNAAVRDAYASMASYMGLDLNNFHYDAHGELVPGPPPNSTHPEAPSPYPAIQTPSIMPQPATGPQTVAGAQPVAVPFGSGSRALVTPTGPTGEIKQGLRRVVLCKNSEGKVGVQLVSVDNGVFVSMVRKDSPAALGGLRFGDQIISVCGKLMAGKSGESAMKTLRKAPVNNIELIVRDRPFERTIMVNKSSSGNIGITLNDGEIIAVVADSSAARNGVLTKHQVVEVNGRNVMGMKDKELKELLHCNRDPVQLTVLPTVIYKHLVKRLLNNQIRREMDRSDPSA